jgi:hypothetical protein
VPNRLLRPLVVVFLKVFVLTSHPPIW